MTRNRIFALAIAIILAGCALAFALTRKTGGDGDAQDAAPTATITTAAVSHERIKDVVSVYGIVQADPASIVTLAAPRAMIVTKLLVRAGETVRSGQPLIELTNAPAADLAYQQAVNAAMAAQSDLARVQRLFDDHLAASDQLGAAKKTLIDAQAALAAQRKQGGDHTVQMLMAPGSAIVTNVAVAPGDHVAQDAALMVLARQTALSAKLGLEPSNQVLVGDTVALRPATGGPAIPSRLTMVGAAADPTTKTLDALAPLGGAGLPIGSTVEADIVVNAHDGLVVPRAAVVFDETGAHVFVIGGGKALRVFVTAGRDVGDQIEISGKILPGDRVAVEGAYELQDGMAVKVAPQ